LIFLQWQQTVFHIGKTLSAVEWQTFQLSNWPTARQIREIWEKWVGWKMATQTESDTWTMSGWMSAQDDNDDDVDDDDTQRK